MFKAITGKSFFVNLLVVIVAVMLLVFLFFSLLGVITKHGENEKVPMVTGQNFYQAKGILEAAGFEVGIQDSVYADTAGPLQVLRQNPDADAVVKSGRTIYLTINRAVPPLVEMPDLRGFSLKSAELYLQSLGLKMGNISYVPDIARNAVKEQKLNGADVAPGAKINMGSSIDLVVGDGIGDFEMDVPDLVGLTVAEARNILQSSNIELGAIIATDAVSDTATAFIAAQKPELFTTLSTGEVVKTKIRAGQIIDIWISTTQPVKDTATLPAAIP